ARGPHRAVSEASRNASDASPWVLAGTHQACLGYRQAARGFFAPSKDGGHAARLVSPHRGGCGTPGSAKGAPQMHVTFLLGVHNHKQNKTDCHRNATGPARCKEFG